MRITAIRERAVPVRSTMRNAAFDFSEMTTSIVAVETDVIRNGHPVAGFAFNSTGRYACGAAMRDRFIPRILSAPPDDLLDGDGIIDPAKVHARMMLREKPGGDAERSIPIGTIETAVWDAVAKILDRPLWHVLAERYATTPHTAVPCYVGGGWYQPGDDLAALKAEISRHLQDGYRDIKIKVGGAPLAADMKRIEAALGLIGDPSHLAVDANAAFSLDRALEYARHLSGFGLRWFEEPCAPLAYDEFAAIAAAYGGPLATGENLFCLQDVINLLQFGGYRLDRDILQVDPPQAYGITAFAQMVERVEAMGGHRSRIAPHGGNMMSFALVAGLGLGSCEAYPGVFGEFGGFADGMLIEEGSLRPPDCPGIGFERQPKLFALMRALVS